MNDNAKLDPEYEFSRPEELFEYDNTLFCNDILFATDAFSKTKNPITDIQQKDSLVINDLKKTLRNQYQLYVGNLTRWTTDQDIVDCITSIGVSDLIDVTFFENYASCQSKGFCIITLHSEHSRKQVLNKLPKEKLYGKSPLVTYVSNEAYLFFDSKSKILPPASLINQNIPNTPNKVKQKSVPSEPFMQQCMSLNGRQSDGSINSYKQGLPHPNDQNQLHRPNHNKYPYKQDLRRRFKTMPGPKHGLLSFDVRYDSSNLAYKQDILIQGHQQSNYAKRLSYTPSSTPCKHNKMEISAQKIDEIMNRNRIVSSSAIAHAITNAANGEFSDAMETLITAISLIKESKVADHECSHILVRYLQDVLHGIEIESYYSRRERKKFDRKLQPRRSCDYDYKNIP